MITTTTCAKTLEAREPTVTDKFRSRLSEANHELTVAANRLGSIGHRLTGEEVFCPQPCDPPPSSPRPTRPTLEEIDMELSELFATLGRLRSQVDTLEKL